MANIIEAERRVSVDENGQPIERLAGMPAKIPKSRKKLNDLDVDNMEESESDEYQANEWVMKGIERKNISDPKWKPLMRKSSCQVQNMFQAKRKEGQEGFSIILIFKHYL